MHDTRRPQHADIDAVRARLKLCQNNNSDWAAVITSISDSDRAVQALADMRLTDKQFEKLIFSCWQAQRNKNAFPTRFIKESEMIKRVAKLGMSINDLRKFVQDVAKGPDDSLSASIYLDHKDARDHLDALNELEHLIRYRERIAQGEASRLGATRKRGDKTAAENAGIGWLAASINEIMGRPFTRHACVLAEAIFEIPEVSEDRLLGARRNIKVRD